MFRLGHIKIYSGLAHKNIKGLFTRIVCGRLKSQT